MNNDSSNSSNNNSTLHGALGSVICVHVFDFTIGRRRNLAVGRSSCWTAARARAARGRTGADAVDRAVTRAPGREGSGAERLVSRPSGGKGGISLKKDFRPPRAALEGPSPRPLRFAPPPPGEVVQSSPHATPHRPAAGRKFLIGRGGEAPGGERPGGGALESG